MTWEAIDRIGTLGLGFVVWALMSGRLVTRREFDGMKQSEAFFRDLAMRSLRNASKLVDVVEQDTPRERMHE